MTGREARPHTEPKGGALRHPRLVFVLFAATALGQVTREIPAAASDGDGFLVVWERIDWDECTNDIACARVTSDGQVLDPAGVLVSGSSSVARRPAVAFTGDDYFVVWEDRRRGRDIYGARVSAAGRVLDSLGVPVCTVPGMRWFPDVAMGDSVLLVAWMELPDTAQYGDLSCARVTPDGRVQDPAGIVVSNVAGSEMLPAVAAGDSCFLVAWTDCRQSHSDIYAARVTETGEVLDPGGVPVCTLDFHQWSVDVVFNGENFVVVWSDEVDGFKDDIFCARVGQDGRLLDTLGIPVCRAQRTQVDASVGCDGSNVLVAWQDGRVMGSPEVYAARVAPDGSVLDPDGRWLSLAPPSQQRPAVGFGGGLYLVVWEQYHNSDSIDVYATRVSAGCAVLDSLGFPIAVGAAVEESQERGVRASGYPSVLRGPGLVRLDCRVIDALGRDVTDKRDRLAPGVYFLHSALGTGHSSSVTKVIVQR